MLSEHLSIQERNYHQSLKSETEQKRNINMTLCSMLNAKNPGRLQDRVDDHKSKVKKANIYWSNVKC